MILSSHFPGLRHIDAWFARIRGVSRGLALLPLCLTLLAPASVRGDIYKWTDEQGNTVISNVRPASTSKVSDVELLATAARPATPAPMAAPAQAPTRTEQALEARIENLERQLQAQQTFEAQQALQAQQAYQAQQAPMDPQASYSGGDIPIPPPPPSDPGYYSGYDPGYYPGYLPGYYNPWPPTSFIVVAPARRFVHRPGFVNRPIVRPRAAAFVGRPTVFAGRAPVSTGRAPAFVGRTTFASSRAGASTGGSMHGGRR